MKTYDTTDSDFDDNAERLLKETLYHIVVTGEIKVFEDTRDNKLLLLHAGRYYHVVNEEVIRRIREVTIPQNKDTLH
jgi:hypothetical protein